jgi:hypothetical protein
MREGGDVLDQHREVIELAIGRRFEFYIGASNVGSDFSAEERGHAAFQEGPLHLGLEVVHEDAAELLDVVLDDCLPGIPSEGLCEGDRRAGLIGELHPGEQTLQAQRD